MYVSFLKFWGLLISLLDENAADLFIQAANAFRMQKMGMWCYFTLVPGLHILLPYLCPILCLTLDQERRLAWPLKGQHPYKDNI